MLEYTRQKAQLRAPSPQDNGHHKGRHRSKDPDDVAQEMKLQYQNKAEQSGFDNEMICLGSSPFIA